MSPHLSPDGRLLLAQRNSVLSVTTGQLRTFTAIAELGSVRAAAAQLNVTESAVSASVASLQRQIGAPLIERAGRGVRLTAAGARYAERVQRLLGELEEAAIAALGEAGPEGGWLRVAAVTSIAEAHLPGLLAEFRARLPGVGIGLEVAPRSRVWQLLRTHAVDLAVAGRPPGDPAMVTYALRPNELIIVAAPDLPTPHDPIAWLLREPGSGIRATLEDFLDSHGTDALRLTLGSNGAVIAGAMAGLGSTLASREVVRGDLAEGRLVEVALAGMPLSRPYHLVGHRDMPPAARRFVDHALASDEWHAPAVPARRAAASRATSKLEAVHGTVPWGAR